MGALDWVKSKAETKPEEFRYVSQEEAEANGLAAGKWRITRKHFRGVLPQKMAYAIRAEKKPLVSNETEHEVLRIGGQYRSDFGKCEYWHTLYEHVGE